MKVLIKLNKSWMIQNNLYFFFSRSLCLKSEISNLWVIAKSSTAPWKSIAQVVVNVPPTVLPRPFLEEKGRGKTVTLLQ